MDRMHFDVIQGDIAAQSADALVNAAGTSLRMGSGVAGALRRAGGEALNEAAMAKGPIGLGEVAVTDAFDLDADIVIHAAAMPHYGDGRATEESVAKATEGALRAAEAHDCRSVVLPVLGTGAAGLDFTIGAETVCEAVAAFDAETVNRVSIIAYDDDQFAMLIDIADRYDGE